ncbi:MAG: hypothetical protein ACXADY_04490 [Candidatus Hodarchaeales archaeon]
MPIFSMDIGISEIDSRIATLLDEGKILLLYSPVSIIEIKWEILRQEKVINTLEKLDGLQTNFQEGLKALGADKNTRELSLTDHATEGIVTILMKQGHKDYFDTVIGAQALLYSNYFLTLDKDLIRQIEDYYKTYAIDKSDQIGMGNWKDFVNFIESD